MPEDKRIRLAVNGHANYAEHGKDIICSAVSILAYTIAENVRSLCKNNTYSISLKKGNSNVDIVFSSDEQYKDIGRQIKSVVKGFEILSEAYPQYVTFYFNGEGESL